MSTNNCATDHIASLLCLCKRCDFSIKPQIDIFTVVREEMALFVKHLPPLFLPFRSFWGPLSGDTL